MSPSDSHTPRHARAIITGIVCLGGLVIAMALFAAFLRTVETETEASTLKIAATFFGAPVIAILIQAFFARFILGNHSFLESCIQAFILHTCLAISLMIVFFPITLMTKPQPQLMFFGECIAAPVFIPAYFHMLETLRTQKIPLRKCVKIYGVNAPILYCAVFYIFVLISSLLSGKINLETLAAAPAIFLILGLPSIAVGSLTSYLMWSYTYSNDPNAKRN